MIPLALIELWVSAIAAGEQHASQHQPLPARAQIIFQSGTSVGNIHFFAYAADRRNIPFGIEYDRRFKDRLPPLHCDYIVEVMPVIFLREPTEVAPDSKPITASASFPGASVSIGAASAPGNHTSLPRAAFFTLVSGRCLPNPRSSTSLLKWEGVSTSLLTSACVCGSASATFTFPIATPRPETQASISCTSSRAFPGASASYRTVNRRGLQSRRLNSA